MMMFNEIDRDQYAVPMSTALVDQNPPPRGPMDTKKNIEQTIDSLILARINECQNAHRKLRDILKLGAAA